MLQGMKRGRLLGLPVISARTGKKIGVVVDIIFKPGHQKIKGLLVSSEGFVERKKHIPLERVRTIGRHAVIVDEPLQNDEGFGALPMEGDEEYGNRILGRQLLRGDGQEVGLISDIILDPNDGTIEGFEISRGLIDDLLEGRYVLPYDASNSINEDAVIVSMEQVQQLKAYNRGIKTLLDIK
ncbi:MAG: PRC-barrel domain-containing protein [Caldicoprobacter sp.]|uniref:PRC-barrel domain-containing protein n=1 Tax=Caldicoprobacter sp. TaxID=2004500 RepID=UPI0039C45A37